MTNAESHLRDAVTALDAATKVVTSNRDELPDATVHYLQAYAGKLHEQVTEFTNLLSTEAMQRAHDRRAELVKQQKAAQAALAGSIGRTPMDEYARKQLLG